MFSTTIELFGQLYRHLDASNAPRFNRDLGCEVQERLQQLNYVIERVRYLEATSNQALSRSKAAFIKYVEDTNRQEASLIAEPPPNIRATDEEAKAYSDALFEMKLLTEAFYYFAGRVRTILRNPQTPIPGLQGFDCDGVRNTRNKLLEHAEGKDSLVSIQSFGWGNANGPVIKAMRYDGQEHIFPDRGLYENAQEFRRNLEILIYENLPTS